MSAWICRIARDIETAPVAEQFGDALRPERRHPIARHEVRQAAIDFVVGGHDLARRRVQHRGKLTRYRPIRANRRRAARREPAARRPIRCEPAAARTSRNRYCRRRRRTRSSARARRTGGPRRRTSCQFAARASAIECAGRVALEHRIPFQREDGLAELRRAAADRRHTTSSPVVGIAGPDRGASSAPRTPPARRAR